MINLFYLILSFVAFGLFVFLFMKVIEKICGFDNRYDMDFEGDCPHCEGKLYSNWHGSDWLEYRCNRCDFSLIYKNVNGVWRTFK